MIVAFAVLRDGDELRRERTAELFARAAWAISRRRARIHFVRDLPKGPSGKVQRLKLQEELAERSLSLATSGCFGSHEICRTRRRPPSTRIEEIDRGDLGNFAEAAARRPAEQLFLVGRPLAARHPMPVAAPRQAADSNVARGFLREPDCRRAGGADQSFGLRWLAVASADASASWRTDLSQDATPPARRRHDPAARSLPPLPSQSQPADESGSWSRWLAESPYTTRPRRCGSRAN